jgi:uncharacterized protein YecE (DUF72 family)
MSGEQAMRWRAGTSGFAYDEWTGSFYPEELPGAQRLTFYAARLPAVEINNTFYRMPKAAVLEGWAQQAGPGFRFALKAPRRITHAKSGDDTSSAAAHLFQVSASLGEACGPLLFQLPPWARKDLARLRGWLAAAPAGRQIALEVRHPSWLDDEVQGLLRDAGVALCAADFDEPERAVPLVPTARFGYLRLRAADYDDAALRRWIAEIAAQPWDEAYVFFKHEDAGAAPRLAARLLALATGEEPPVREPRRAERPRREPVRTRPAPARARREGDGA